MKKLLGIIVLGLLLVSCTEKEEKYFTNCMKDGKKYTRYSEDTLLEFCRIHKENALDEFKYYEGKVFSRNEQNTLTPDEADKIGKEMMKRANKKNKEKKNK